MRCQYLVLQLVADQLLDEHVGQRLEVAHEPVVLRQGGLLLDQQVEQLRVRPDQPGDRGGPFREQQQLLHQLPDQHHPSASGEALLATVDAK